MKVCEVCKGKFKPKNSQHVRCSKECSKEAVSKKDKATLLIKIPCVICSELFQRKVVRRVCCYKEKCINKKAKAFYRPLHIPAESSAARSVNKFLQMPIS